MAEITHAILTSAKSQKFLQVIGYSNSTSDCEALINAHGDQVTIDIFLKLYHYNAHTLLLQSILSSDMDTTHVCSQWRSS